MFMLWTLSAMTSKNKNGGDSWGILYGMEGYQCQKSTLCNKRSNKKECGINKKERGILQALA